MGRKCIVVYKILSAIPSFDNLYPKWLLEIKQIRDLSLQLSLTKKTTSFSLSLGGGKENAVLESVKQNLTLLVTDFEANPNSSLLLSDSQKTLLKVSSIYDSNKHQIVDHNHRLWLSLLEKMTTLIDELNEYQETRSDKSYHTGTPGWSSGTESISDAGDNEAELHFSRKRNQDNVPIRFCEEDSRIGWNSSYSFFNKETQKWSTPLKRDEFESKYPDVQIPSFSRRRRLTQEYSDMHNKQVKGTFKCEPIAFKLEDAHRKGGITTNKDDRGTRNQLPVIDSNKIVQLNNITHRVSVASWDIEIFQTQNNKYVMQQGGEIRSTNCGPTCIAMLSLDQGCKKIDLGAVTQNVAKEMNADQLYSYLSEDLALYCTECKTDGSENILSKIASIIQEKGSSIVGLNNPAHYIIIDELKDDYATIRDPWHGWSIDISTNTLLELIGNQEPIQIVSVLAS